MTFLIIDYMKKKKKKITSIIEANNLLKAGYVLVIVENKTAICIKESAYFLMNENWHTKIKEDDFMEMFENNTFMIWENSLDEGIKKKKDEEYYAWRHKYL